MMQAQARPSYESSSSKAYDALIDQLENLPSPSNEPEITFNEPAPVPTEQNNDAHIAPPTIAAPVQDNTASETTSQSHGNSYPQGLILPAQEPPQPQQQTPSYNNFNGYAPPREEPRPTYVAPPQVQSQPSYALPQTRLPPSVSEKYSGYPTLDHSESASNGYPSLDSSSAEDKIKNILQMYPGNPPPQQKPQPIMPQVQPAVQPVVSQPQYSPQQSPQVQPARPFYPAQLQPQQQQIQPQPQPQLNSLYSQPAVQPKPTPQPTPQPQIQHQMQPASPVVARPPQPVVQQQAPAPAPQQVQQLAQAQIQSQQINQQTVQVQVQQQQQIQVLQAQQMQQQNMIQQQIQYSKEMCIQMQSYFERIARFMENVDKRLNNLERVTNDMVKNTSHASGNANPPPSYPSTTTSEVPIESMFDRSELERLKKLQSQFDDDAAVAKRLQDEYEREAAKSASASKLSSSSTSSSSKTTTPTPKSTSEKYDTCPICQVQIVSSKLAQHVNECLDGPSAYNDAKTPTPTPTPTGEEKKGFWSSIFGAKKDDSATPTPTPQSFDLTQNPPQNSKGTFYAAPVMPTGTPSAYPQGTPGAYPQGTSGAYPQGYPMVYPYQFPGNAQPMYYYMPGPGQPQAQPKK